MRRRLSDSSLYTGSIPSNSSCCSPLLHSLLLVELLHELCLRLRHPVTQIHGNTSAVFLCQMNSIFSHHSQSSNLPDLWLLLHATCLVPCDIACSLPQPSPYLHVYLSTLVVQQGASISIFFRIFKKRMRHMLQRDKKNISRNSKKFYSAPPIYAGPLKYEIYLYGPICLKINNFF